MRRRWRFKTLENGKPERSLAKLGRYELNDVLGKGAMGVVHLGLDTIIDRVVAIKTLTSPGGDYDALYNEARIAGKLTHPNIAMIYDVGEDGGVHYIVMEYVKGVTMKEMIGQKSPISPTEKIAVIVNIARALHYAHQRGIIHRDIKPANIMLLDDKQIKIMDFGIAKTSGKGDTNSGRPERVMGTPAYMSPEQAVGGKLDRQTDVFSLGVLSYELLTGEKPFTADNIQALLEKIRKDTPSAPSEVEPAIPPELGVIIMKALEKDKQKRFATTDAFADQLEIFLEKVKMTSTLELPAGFEYDRDNLIQTMKQGYTFFSDFTYDELLKIIGISAKNVYRKGDLIIKESEIGRKMYVIISGVVRIIKDYGKDNAVLLTELKEGACFGELAFLENAPRIASGVAWADSVMMEINEVVIRTSEPQLCLKLYKNLSSIIVDKLKKSTEKNETLLAEIKKSGGGELRCAAAKLVFDSGFFEHALPLFESATGIKVRVQKAEAGTAFNAGKKATVDVLITDSRDAEIRLAAEHWFVNRRELMTNDFVILGPTQDPAGVKGVKTVVEIFKRIAAGAAPFVSRGDDSGTHHKELSLWKRAGVDPTPHGWYLEVGFGMNETVAIADRKNAYTLCDEGAYLAVKPTLQGGLVVLWQGGPELKNHIGIMAVNPLKHPHVKFKEAMEFVNWLTSSEGQVAVSSFKDKNGNRWFHPNS
jgi:serine/threonine-protein kinase